ncbi:phage portal protein [Vibrio alfacsensis]|uniref:phage portal protein n=1 Tax=Vibrio alfacsensis TaxID=1074311 RepID=UPI001BEF901E|nr:phage portal protein [Vibrio alfacsensis]BBM66348.1 phage portal protein [Vibrio alfacsensis]
MAKATIQRMVVSEQRRMYDSASPDRMTLSWDSNPYTADQVIYHQLEILRARSRHQARNNDYVIRLIQVLQDNIVGASGFKLRSKVYTKQGRSHKKARQLVESAWQAFEDCSSLVEIEKLIISAMVTDGESFVFLRTDRKGNLRPELIDPCRIDVNFNDTQTNGNAVVMGIEYDELMDPVAYHINDSYEREHPGVGAAYTGKRTRIPAEHILHVFRKLFVGQKRGIPWVAPSLGRLFQLSEAEKAALTAFRIGAAKMGFFSSPEDEEYTGDGESGEMMLNAEAGTFENIGNLQFHAFDPSYPSGDFAPFVERILKGVSSGWGVDYHTIGNDLSGVNYSSARVGSLDTRENYKGLQGWVVQAFVKPLFNRFIELCQVKRSFGGITLSAQELQEAQFVGRRWDWVDPQKEANGKKILYELKAISLSQIIRDRGDDPEDVFLEIAEENHLMEQLGITPAQVFAAIEHKKEENEEEE